MTIRVIWAPFNPLGLSVGSFVVVGIDDSVESDDVGLLVLADELAGSGVLGLPDGSADSVLFGLADELAGSGVLGLPDGLAGSGVLGISVLGEPVDFLPQA